MPYTWERYDDEAEAAANAGSTFEQIEPCDLCGALAPLTGLATDDPDAAHACEDCTREDAEKD
jgi:hypothetical protein